MITGVRRGANLDELVLFGPEGRCLHIVTYGFTPDEGARNGQELIRWLAASGIPLVDAEGRRL